MIVIFSMISDGVMIQAAQDDEDFEDNNLIMLCCTWGEKLIDGKLTYDIQGNVDGDLEEAVRDAIKDWDDKLDLIEFIEVPYNLEKNQRQGEPDIQIKFLKDGTGFEELGAETAGHTKTRLNQQGFIHFNIVTIAEGGLGKTFEKETIETIAKHEIGHTLGLGHANFKSNLMATEIDFAAKTISACELEAVQQANSWKFLDKESGGAPQLPSMSNITCED